jgi:hypothetical protein
MIGRALCEPPSEPDPQDFLAECAQQLAGSREFRLQCAAERGDVDLLAIEAVEFAWAEPRLNRDRPESVRHLLRCYGA